VRAKLSRIKKDIETLATYTSTPSSGVTRLPFTPEDKKAREYIKEQMINSGLKVRVDGVGTIIGRREGTKPNAPVIMLGSHYDSVKNGGAFDGTAGLVAALEVVRVLNSEDITTKYPIEVVAMNDEEGVRFKGGMLSSRAIIGEVTDEELDTSIDEDGISIKQAMVEFGIKPNLHEAKYQKGAIKAFMELHIEQGPILEANKKEIGIVKSIVGLSTYKVNMVGRAGHAGTTPMDLRVDALLAASKAIIELNTIVKETGGDTVGTVGELQVQPSVANVIPGTVEFTIDVRSSVEGKIREVIRKFEKVLKKIENSSGVKSSLKETFYAPPVVLSEMIINQMKDEVSSLGYRSICMDSGAGHDAMVMAEHAPTGMIFVPSKNGISHTQEEWTDYEDIQKGAEVLFNTVIALNNND
jgi:allantoate deiminase